MALKEVILVNQADEAVGTMEKMQAHQKALLHRAFSVFIFNNKKEMLLQQRSDKKYHSAGLWTNACCSHPSPGEDTAFAAEKRLQEELGFTVPLQKIFTFVYRSDFENGLTEHEFDHVFTGIYEGEINPDHEEVKDFVFVPVNEIEASLKLDPGKYTSWFHIAFPKVKEWMKAETW